MCNCAACNTAITDYEFTTCIRCFKKYHTLCITYPLGDNKTEQAPNTWQCPPCLINQPSGENSNGRVSSSISTADMTVKVIRQNVDENIQETLQTEINKCAEHLHTEIRDIIREELSNSLQETAAALTKTFIVNLKEIKEEIREFGQSLSFLCGEFNSLESDNNLFRNEINQVRKQNELLRSELVDIKARCNQLDQLFRTSNVEIQCVPENKSENLIDLVKRLAHVVNVVINENDIQYCTRIAKLNPGSTRPRTILTKFNSPRARDTLIWGVIKYNNKNVQDKLNTHDLGFTSSEKSPVFVVENLSPENKNLLAATRQRTKELQYKFIWVRGGRIFVRKSETTRKIFIRNFDSLNHLK